MKNIKKIVCFILCVIFAFVTPFHIKSHATNMSNITSDAIKEMENQINKAETERENLKNSISDMKKLVADLENTKKDLKKYVAKLDENLEEIEKRVTELKLQISTKEAQLVETERKLENALKTEETQHDSMASHIKFIYENGSSYYLTMLLNAESIGDLLNKSEYVNALASYDRERLENFVLTRQMVELLKAELEVDKQYLEEAKAAVEIEQNNLETLITQKSNEITSYENNIANKEQAIKEYEAEQAAQDELIAATEAAIAEEKKKIIANSGIVLKYDGGVFKFPLASYTRISDDYGYRIHPILGVQQFHNGVDFAAPKGTAIYAAYDGVVVAATYSSTMGNYVMIDHGDGLFTIYMHASALYVSKGDIVVRGETIAAVGSTGRSTGNHLHFSVRQNGEYVSPWNFLSQ